MEDERLTRAESIFQSAADLPPEDRPALLSEQCGGDAELRALLEDLLARHDDEGGFLEADSSSTRTATEVEGPSPSGPGRIGPYVLRERIGAGGMGEVFRAEQMSPVRRTVALKRIRAGMDSEQVLARFEAERQALALMDHPYIAKVHDAGVTDDGRPYFVMEHVPGTPITDYCDRRRLDTRERLELFERVCEGVQHAHQKAVIHRDIKPTNILVADVDGKPLPKIIDFGVAKATSRKLTEKTMHTAIGQIIGTPEYMSPEQADLTSEDVDTRTDVYSLGVVLYELLVGSLPFEPDELRKAGLEGILRTLREKEPPRPSTKISTLGAKTTEIAKRRRTEPRRLAGQMKGDLDWIVMRALEKDRNRRYGSPRELAQDVRRHLSDQPVLAGPPTAAYRSRKFVKRHRVGVGFAGTVFLAVGVGFVVVTAQKADIAAAREEAELVITSLEEMLASVGPTKGGRDVTVREVLDETAKTLGEKFREQPFVEARLRYTVGRVYQELGEYDEAERHFRKAIEIRRERLGKGNPGTLEIRIDLVGSLYRQGRYAEAEVLARETMEIGRRVLGEDHPSTLDARGVLAETYRAQGRYGEADAVFRETLETSRRVLGEEHPTNLDTMARLGGLYQEIGRYSEATRLREEALAISRRTLGEEHPTTLEHMRDLASAYGAEGRSAEGGVLRRNELRISRRVLGKEHPWTLGAMNNLAVWLEREKRFEEAWELQREHLEITRRVYGDSHPATHLSIGNLITLCGEMGRQEEAVALAEQRLEVDRRVLGVERPETQIAMSSLAAAYRAVGRYDEAVALGQDVVEIRRELLGSEHPRTLESVNNLGFSLLRQGRHEEAVSLLRKTLDTQRRLLGNEHGSTLITEGNLAAAYQASGGFGAAESLWREQLETRRRLLGEEDSRTLDSQVSLAECLSLQGRHEDSGELFREALEVSRRVLGESHLQTNDLRYRMACDAMRRGNPREATSFLRDALDHGWRGRLVRGDAHRNPLAFLDPIAPIGDEPDLAALRGDPEFEAIVEELLRRNREDDRTARSE